MEPTTTDSPSTESPKKFPRWTKSLFDGFLANMQELSNLLKLSRGGIALQKGLPDFLKMLKPRNEQEQKLLEAAQEHAKLASTEIENDFPLLHGQSVVSLWGALESFMRSLVAQWIENVPGVLSEKPFAGLKVDLGEYLSMDPRDQSRHVVDLFEQKSGSSRSLGVKRFEALMEAIGLSGSVEEDVSKTLFELQQVRNVIVHRRGIADRRLCELCPWLGLKVGDPIRVRGTDVDRYGGAVHKYVLEVAQRIRVKFGMERYMPPDTAATDHPTP
jgi:hypothetical protein